MSKPRLNSVSPSHLDGERGLCRRSKRMPLAEAKRLCARLANLANILEPEVVKVKWRPSGDTAMVQWQPLKPGTRQNDLAMFIAAREATAAAQAELMSFYEVESRPEQYLCVNDDFHGQEFHFLTADHAECDCGDWQYRCHRLSEMYGVPVPCHHLVELHKRIEDGTLQPLPDTRRHPAPPTVTARPVETSAERQARMAANIAADFS